MKTEIKRYQVLVTVMAAVIVALLAACNGSILAGHKSFAKSPASRQISDNTGCLTGRVTSKETGDPLANVVIEDIHQTFTGATDWNGDYRIILIPPGEYKIRFAIPNGAVKVVEKIVIHANRDTELNVEISDEDADACTESEEGIRHVLSVPKKLKESACRIMGKSAGGATDNATIYRVMCESAGGAETRSCSRLGLQADFNTEQYNRIYPNEFQSAAENPLSTFSIDVDAASYSNVRRFINNGSLPPADAVRVEEMINYFSYDYSQPKGEHPFSITTEVSPCPWNRKHRLVHIGLQGYRKESSTLPPNNLVFLLDVSGSMNMPNKLPLLKAAFRLLVGQLRQEDRVAIVVYAGNAGMVLESTPGDNKSEILEALGRLQAGGSTAGGEGIGLAYRTARANFIENGNNRVIHATDGDFNVGVSSDGELVRMIEEERQSGVYLTALGFGTGNYKDSKMEQLADKGNGNYAYIDNIQEAKKVLVDELGATLLTIAKDVKIQVEFNPTKVKAYRLIGYENRLLNKEDFNDDLKDAGEIGAGHSVTALYEVVPVSVEIDLPNVDDLKYQKTEIQVSSGHSNELLTVKFRYKPPASDQSKLIVEQLIDRSIALDKTSDNFRFSAAVAEFGMLLTDSKFKSDATFDAVIELAKQSKGTDEFGYRGEFVRLVEMCKLYGKDS